MTLVSIGEQQWEAGAQEVLYGRTSLAGRFLSAQVVATVLVVIVVAALAAGLTPPVRGSSLLLTVSVAWILYSWARVMRTIASPYWLFVLAAALFNGGQAILEVFGWNPNGVLESRFTLETTSGTILYSTLCLMLLHLGALGRVAKDRSRVQSDRALHKHKALQPNDALEHRAVRLGLLLVLISVVPMFLQMQQDLGDVMGAGYFSLYQREALTNISAWRAILAQFMLPGAFLLASSARDQKALRWLSLGIVTIYALAYLFMGYRGGAAAAIAAFGWIWHTRVSRLPLVPCVVAGLAGILLIFPMIRQHRGARGDERLSWSSFVSTLENYDNPAIASLTEIGGTMATTAYTMDLVPTDREFEYGKTYIFGALTMVPNIFGTALHPSVARGTASDWLVRTISYQTAVAGGGVGYSFIAEAYLNFGWMGPPLVMILLGFGYASVECFALRSNSPAAVSLMGVVLLFSLIYTRAESANIVRSIVWCGFMPVAVLGLFSGSTARKVAQPVNDGGDPVYFPTRRKKKIRPHHAPGASGTASREGKPSPSE